MIPALLALALLGAPARAQDGAPDPVLLYSLALEHLLGAPGEHDFVVQATPAETARRVTARLARQGYRVRRGAGAQLRLGLGGLRLEPPRHATFARLRVEVSSTAGGGEVLEFLLKREPGGWRVLKSEVEGSVGALRPAPTPSAGRAALSWAPPPARADAPSPRRAGA